MRASIPMLSLVSRAKCLGRRSKLIHLGVRQASWREGRWCKSFTGWGIPDRGPECSEG